jgi:hypothetical protein
VLAPSGIGADRPVTTVSTIPQRAGALPNVLAGITEHGEPAVVIAFAESAADPTTNVPTLGFDLRQFETDDQLVTDRVEATAGGP